MRTYAGGGRCLMQVLIEALDDPDAGPCGRCSVCTGELPGPGRTPGAAATAAATQYLRGRQYVLEPRQLWPSGSGRRGKIAGLAPGRAVAFADDPAWSAVIAELAGADAEPSEELRGGLVDVLKAWSGNWGERPVAVVPLPSRSHPRRVAGMAAHIGAIGRLPVLDVLRATGPAPAPELASAGRVESLLAGLSLDPDAPPMPEGPVLLIDDVSRTGWTLTAAAALLRDGGAGPVLPLVGHRRP